MNSASRNPRPLGRGGCQVRLTSARNASRHSFERSSRHSGRRDSLHTPSSAPRQQRCSDKDRPVGPFLPAGRPGPGGLKGRGAAWRRRRHVIWRPVSPAAHSANPDDASTAGATRSRSVVRKTRRVLTTLPHYVRQAAGIRRILATSRESSTLSNDSESRAARRRSRLEPCEWAARRFHRLERDGGAVPRPASRRRECRGRSGPRNPVSEHYRDDQPDSHLESPRGAPDDATRCALPPVACLLRRGAAQPRSPFQSTKTETAPHHVPPQPTPSPSRYSGSVVPRARIVDRCERRSREQTVDARAPHLAPDGLILTAVNRYRIDRPSAGGRTG